MHINKFGSYLNDEGIDYHVVLVGMQEDCCKGTHRAVSTSFTENDSITCVSMQLCDEMLPIVPVV